MDYDLADFYENVEAQFADEEEAMGDLIINEEEDHLAQYQVSDDLLKRAMEEEALLSEKENKASSANSVVASNTSAMESQMKAFGDSLASTDATRKTAPNSYPVIAFSFMQNSAEPNTQEPPPPIQIRNSYRGGQAKRSASAGVEEDELGVEEIKDPSSKRSRTDPQIEKVLTRIPEGDFIKISTDDQRVFLKVKPYIEKVNALSSPDNLLNQPFQYLKAHVMRDYHEKRQEVEAAVSRIRSHVVPAARSRVAVDEEQSNLWVNEYMPTKYVDLLSDDGINRAVLLWLKLWDGVVFGKKMREKAPVEKPKWQSLETWQRFQNKQEPEYDERGYPYRKTILLAGPPGLGKTTVAHISAKHAGYNVVEMNASDDRSAAQFTEAIESSIRMTGVLNRDNMPNCLIIDEIDGAGAQAIQVLVKVLNAGTAFSAGGADKTDKKKKKKERRLRRPIICICNDPWGAQLRDLRKIATIMTIPPTQSARLATRLKGICTMEQLTADMASLLYLCEKTDNDIRSSLNTLQFLKSKSEPLSMVRLKSMDIGLKDKQQSLFKFWSLILTQPKTKGSALQRLTNDQRHDQQRLSDLINLVYGTGEYEKQVEGIHENLLLLKIREANFPKLADSLDWFIFYDSIDSIVRKSMAFELYPYLSYVPIAFNLLFAQVHPPKIVIPSKARETTQRIKEVAEISDIMKREVQVKARLGLSCEYLSTELASYLARLLCPAFRPVNIQLYSEKERKAKEDLVNIMACYDLQFVQHRTAEGVVSYMLEPDVYGVTRFTGFEEIKQLSYTIKQMLAREVDMKRIEVDGSKSSQSAPAPLTETKPSVPTKKIDFSKEVVPINYLSKVVSNKDAFKRKKEAYIQKDRTFYKFNEGFSNAVRKPVKMSTFF